MGGHRDIDADVAEVTSMLARLYPWEMSWYRLDADVIYHLTMNLSPCIPQPGRINECHIYYCYQATEQCIDVMMARAPFD